MKLSELAAEYPYKGKDLDGCKIFPYPHQEPRFWNLTDYAVSSVTGGSIYLVPKKSK